MVGHRDKLVRAESKGSCDGQFGLVQELGFFWVLSGKGDVPKYPDLRKKKANCPVLLLSETLVRQIDGFKRYILHQLNPFYRNCNIGEELMSE